MTRTILVVEDQKDLQNYLKEFLVDNEYLVITASDGIQALNAINKSRPDLVLLDLGLPNMSGESVVLEVRKKWPELRIIILSARNDILHERQHKIVILSVPGASLSSLCALLVSERC